MVFYSPSLFDLFYLLVCVQLVDDPEVLVNSLKPKEIVDQLDKHIVGQADAKKAVAVAFRTRWRRQQLSKEMKNEVFLPMTLTSFFFLTLCGNYLLLVHTTDCS